MWLAALLTLLLCELSLSPLPFPFLSTELLKPTDFFCLFQVGALRVMETVSYDVPLSCLL